MVYPEKSRSVAIACPEWSSVEYVGPAKVRMFCIHALSLAKVMLQGETYSTEYYCIWALTGTVPWRV